MYNKLPLLWRTNKSILILYIESCTRITATSFLYSWGAQWMSALTYLSQEVWAYYSAKFPTYFFQLLKRNIPQGMNEGLTTFISVFQNATSSVGEFFLTRSGQCFVTLNIDETITFQLKFLWLTNIYIYVYIKINISNSGCLNTQSKPCMSCTFLQSFFLHKLISEITVMSTMREWKVLVKAQIRNRILGLHTKLCPDLSCNLWKVIERSALAFDARSQLPLKSIYISPICT